MIDRELLDALNVIARKAGLLPDGVRFAYELVPDAPRDDALCLAFGKYRETRLCCTEGRGHAGSHSWERAMVGKSACIARTAEESANLLCQRPTHHAGEHKATGADGVRWTWGDAPQTPPCQCGPDVCNGEPGHVGAADVTRCVSTQPGSGMRCIRPTGHEGEHRKLMQRWSDSEPDPSAPRA